MADPFRPTAHPPLNYPGFQPQNPLQYSTRGDLQFLSSLSYILVMSDSLQIRENYALSKCCSPLPDCEIIGYYSHDGILLKVHRATCANLQKVDQTRLVSLAWSDILADEQFIPDDDYHKLDDLDFRVLAHHTTYGVDYSLTVARQIGIDKQKMFDRHRKLRKLKLLKRVEPVMIQYRKGIVDNKWIKHRNHTYYDLTTKGKKYLEYWRKKES